eukprot:COSAG05_NODE_21299_length_273_cov_0.557471_1_plen_67_part_01
MAALASPGPRGLGEALGCLALAVEPDQFPGVGLGQQGTQQLIVHFFKQKTAYEILRSDWSSDVCSSD